MEMRQTKIKTVERLENLILIVKTMTPTAHGAC